MEKYDEGDEVGRLKWAEALIDKTVREHPEYLALDELPGLDDEEKIELADASQRDEDFRAGKTLLLSEAETVRR